MSRPPINPEKTLAGITVDPCTLERVIPESKRPDGTTRKQIKIRPGFTPQEDVRRFRGTKQAQMDANALPKGHIIGWTPPSSSTTKPGAVPGSGSGSGTAGLSKNAKKRQKQREKKAEVLVVKDNWDDEEEEERGTDATPAPATKNPTSTTIASDSGKRSSGTHTTDQLNKAAAPDVEKKETIEELGLELEKLEVR